MMPFLLVLLLIYVIYTLNFAIKFNRAKTSLSENQKLYHNILIWLIPFFWIVIVKAFIGQTPGSAKFKTPKPSGGFYESGIGFWGYNEGHHDGDDGGGSDGGND